MIAKLAKKEIDLMWLWTEQINSILWNWWEEGKMFQLQWIPKIFPHALNYKGKIPEAKNYFPFQSDRFLYFFDGF